MMTFEPIPDPFGPEAAPAAASAAAPLGPASTTPLEPPRHERAGDPERALTSALAALKHRGQRAAANVEAAATLTKILVGGALVLGLGTLIVYAAVRAARPRPRRRVGVAGAIARALARELAQRVLIGVATTAGAQLAQTVLVPTILAAISLRASAARNEPRRGRRSRAPAPVDGVSLVRAPRSGR